MVIDTHTHLDMKEFDTDQEAVIKRALEAGVEKIITVGVDLESSREALNLAAEHSNIYAAVGIQPEEIDQYFDGSKISTDIRSELEKLVKNKKVVAIGEIGLDYKYIREKVKSDKEELINLEKEKQKEIFRRQLGLAVTLALPAIIHSRDADDDTLTEILRYRETRRLRGVIHCFTGTYPFARKVLDAGFYVSLSGIVTFPNAKELREVVKQIPLDKILVETDSPLIAPRSHRGARNEPSFVVEVIKEISEIKNLTPAEVETVTSKNAEKLFRLW
ncbi:MAG: TatD family hydrolase [Patescibacteria group bacterium]|nr:TatD family hydrolase [Patescibacteria group bacterium]